MSDFFEDVTYTPWRIVEAVPYFGTNKSGWQITRSMTMNDGNVVCGSEQYLSSNGVLGKTYKSTFMTRNEAVLALDRWKIRQLPELGTAAPTPWSPIRKTV